MTKQLRKRLSVRRFLRPGPLWWAFDWESATEQARLSGSPVPTLDPGADPTNGCVVLIDEIDKADTDVPNGLLEALGSGEFTPLGSSETHQGRRRAAAGHHHHERGTRVAECVREALSRLAIETARRG